VNQDAIHSPFSTIRFALFVDGNRDVEHGDFSSRQRCLRYINVHAAASCFLICLEKLS